jgi:hypothetical protein
VAGPTTGVSLTAESGDPYPHHRSLLFACDRVNGANYWQEGLERGQIVSRGPQIAEPAGARVVLADACDWRVQDGPADVTDQRRFAITAPSPDLRLIEADITLTAARDVQILRTNHSLFSVRAAPELTPSGGGTLVDSEGRSGEKANSGRRPRGAPSRRAVRRTRGIALLDHAGNRGPALVRATAASSLRRQQWIGDDGCCAGDTLRLRYRCGRVCGTPDEQTLRASTSGGRRPARRDRQPENGTGPLQAYKKVIIFS